MIRHEHGKWKLYSKDGSKLLGTHDTEAEAKTQEAAVEAAKHRSAEEARQLHVLGATGVPRVEKYQGREHLVVPVVALIGDQVIHAVNAQTPEHVPARLLAQMPNAWNGRPLVLGHPVKDGVQISANDPRVMEQQAFGFMAATHCKDKRLGTEAWMDVARLQELGQHKMLEDARAGKPIEVSVGAFVTTNGKAGMVNGRAYKNEWTSLVPDHLAFLPGGTGACSVAMGCGSGRYAQAHLVTAGGYELTPVEGSTIQITLDGEVIAEQVVKNLGGQGSGNFGHEGRPGERGGSGDGGGSSSGEKEVVKTVIDMGAGTPKSGKQFKEGTAEHKEAVRTVGQHAHALSETLENEGLNWSDERFQKGHELLKKLDGMHRELKYDGRAHAKSVRDAVKESRAYLTRNPYAPREPKKFLRGAASKDEFKVGDSVEVADTGDYGTIASVEDGKFAVTCDESGKSLGSFSADELKTCEGENMDTEPRSLRERFEALLRPFLKTLDDAEDPLEVESEAEDSAELISYQAIEELIDQAEQSLYAGKEQVTALIEDLQDSDDEIEDARLEALVSMCVQLYGTVNGIIKIATSQLSEADKNLSPIRAYMAHLASKNEEKDITAIQEAHAHAHELHQSLTDLGATCEGTKLLSAGADSNPADSNVADHNEGEDTMDKTQRAATITALMSSECGCFKDSKPVLEALTDSGLEGTLMLSKAGIRGLALSKDDAEKRIAEKAIADKNAEDAKQLKAAADKKTEEENVEKKQNEAEVKAAEARLTAAKAAGFETVEAHEQAEFYKKNPEIKALVDRQKAQDAARKDELVTALKTAQKVHDEAKLKTFSLERLEEIAELVNVPKPDFSGRGVAVRTAESKDDVFANPPDPYAKGLEVLRANRGQGSKAVN